MSGEVTSPGVARWVPGEWRAFAAFLRRPTLPQRVTGIRRDAVAATARLFALDLAMMALVLAVIGVATAAGLKLPTNEIDKLTLGPLWLTIIIVVAPIMEELAFRSWLSGRPGHVTALIALGLGVAIPIASGMQGHPILLLGGLGIGLVVALGLLFWLRKRPPFAFFGRHFAWFYAAAALAFALIHMTNYSQGMGVNLLPLVVPQLLVGLILGYARVTYGLWSDIALHMSHNALLIALVLLQKGGL
jgi:membrane protease YdiL (CAAX protease family)